MHKTNIVLFCVCMSLLLIVLNHLPQDVFHFLSDSDRI
jgi:hypothetical protein